MFNLYSKLTTALAAFAIICSTPIMAQCVDVNINVGGGSWLSEVSWDIVDADGNFVASGAAGLSTVCIDEGCYTFYGYDSYGDGWNGSTASIADLNGNIFLDGFTLPVGSSLETTEVCIEAIEAEACDANDVSITVGGGAYASEVSWNLVDADGNVVADGIAATSSACLADGCYTFNGLDSYGDGWNGNTATITGADGSVYLNAFTFESGSAASADVCINAELPVVCEDEAACNYGAEGECTYAEEGFDCDGNAIVDCLDVSWTVGGGSYPSEVSWSVIDADGATVLASGGVGSGVVCLPLGCFTFVGADSYGDGWNGNTATFTINGVNVIDGVTVEGSSGVWDFCISNDIPGCTDSSASNYNEAATVNDGSCCYDDLVTINLFDSFGDGWGAGNGLTLDGVLYEVTGAAMSMELCLPAGCYTGEITYDAWPEEISWSVVVNGVEIAVGSYTGFFFSTDPSCVVTGCNDEIACNYDPAVNVNDGSCDYSSCAGCTDAGACNYDETATLDDASCDYSCVGCMDSTANNYDADATIACADCCLYCELDQLTLNMYDSYGDGWNANSLTINGETFCFPDVNGDCSTTNVWTNWSNQVVFNLCLDLAECFEVIYNADGAYQTENSWDIVDADGNVLAEGGAESGNFGDCSFGCNDEMACNFDGSDINDGSCDYSCVGCTDNTAANYDPNATMDSGDCVYCADGSFVLTVDMTDSFGDGWNGAEYYIYDLASGALAAQGSLDAAYGGDAVSSGYDLICLAPGCYNVQVTEGSFPGEVGLSLSDQFGNNYGSFGAGATYPVDFLLTGTCGFEGCTSPSAINFNISATIDDGSCQEPPSNDQLANAEAVFCGAYVSGTLLYATDDQGLIGGDQFGNAAVTTGGVWYVLNSDSDQQVTVSTCDTPGNEADTDYVGDTKIHVYTMGADGSLMPMVSNDDGCETGFLSTAAFTTVTGADYYIYVSKYSAFTAGNDFVMSVNCVDCGNVPSNDDCDGAIAQVSGVTFTGSTCCANAESMQLGWAGFGTAYGVWFTFNSSDYDTFDFDATNLTNENLGFVMMMGDGCDDVEGFVGCQFTGTCAGDVSGFTDLEPNTDYYFLIYTADPTGCGEFEFTTTGVYLGCTDATANNYDPQATMDDGSCDFDGVVPANDLCADAISLDCNTVVTGSTGGSTSTGTPIGVEGCEVSPGTGVWYTFTGNGQLHNLSTCGSAIDSKINIYTAEVECGGSVVDVPAPDACGEGLVTVNYTVGGGSWQSEVGWDLIAADGSIVATGGAPASGSLCLAEGDYTLSMTDAYGDGWNGNAASFSNGLGDVIGFAGLDAGVSGTATITVSAYSMEPILIPGDFTCFASATGSDGTGACTLFDSDDVNFEFVSEVGVLYYVYVGAEDSDGNPITDDNGTFDLVFDCADVVEGCMNPAACNYDENANVATDTCDFWSCTCEGEGVAVMLSMNDSFGDGWNGAEYFITDLAGNPVTSGSLDNAQFFVDENNFAGPEYGFDMICLAAGCYNIEVTAGSWSSEISWDITTEDGTVLLAGGAPDSQTISVGGAVCGCTDAGACNYDETATDEDGSCEYETCAGCTDAASCSYDEAATIDDGSCCYSNCVSIQMNDSFGDGWNGGYYVLSTVDGTVIGEGGLETGSAGTDAYCLEDGCYVIDVVGASFAAEMSWTVLGAFGGLVTGGADESATFNVGSGDQCVVGCDISCACNYDPAANISDVAQCVFEGCDGCTYPDASNYDETAIADNGTCEFDIANPCPADLNGDGSITTGDLLIFLGAFGTICE